MIIITGPDYYVVDPTMSELPRHRIVRVACASGYVSRTLDMRDLPVGYSPRTGLYVMSPRFDTQRYHYRLYVELPDGYNVYTI